MNILQNFYQQKIFETITKYQSDRSTILFMNEGRMKRMKIPN